MKYNDICIAVLEVFRECNIHSFPFRCSTLLEHYGYKIFSYSQIQEMNSELYDICVRYSDDAFHDQRNRLILYNQAMISTRIRFTLMHELGHVILKHHGESEQQESEANTFAGLILAPRMAIHYSRFRTAEDISSVFNISYEAAQCALRDYYQWYDHIQAYKMSSLDWDMYRHFYNEDQKRFVWNIRQCRRCRKTIYNSRFDLCPECDSYIQSRKQIVIPVPSDMDYLAIQERKAFLRAESRWLHGD